MNQRDVIHGETALHWAVRHHQTTTMDTLLQHKANPNVPDLICGQTPLHLACNLNFNGSFLDVVQKLINHGGNVNLTEKGSLDTAFHIAARSGCKEVIDILLQTTIFGANVNARNAIGETPLMVAVKGGHENVVVGLVNAGSRINDLSMREKENALHIAIQRCYFDIAMQLLRHGCNANQENASGEMPLLLLLSDIARNPATPNETTDRLLSSMVFVGARLGCICNTKPIERSVSAIRSSNSSLSSTILACLHPPRLLHSCVDRIRHQLSNVCGDNDIIPAISKLPLPTLLKEKMTLSFQ